MKKNKTNDISLVATIMFSIVVLIEICFAYLNLKNSTCYEILGCSKEFLLINLSWVSYAIIAFGIHKSNYKLLIIGSFLIVLLIIFCYLKLIISGSYINIMLVCFIAYLLMFIVVVIFSLRKFRLKRVIAKVIVILPILLIIFISIYRFSFYYLNMFYNIFLVTAYIMFAVWLLNNKYSDKNVVNDSNKGVDIKKDKKKVDNESDIADKLKEYKDLLDQGVITKEDFELKKKKLLDL